MPTTADQAVYEVLAAHAGLAALVSDRIYHVEAPQGASIPMVILQAITTSPQTTHGADDGRLDSVIIQITALAETQLICANILRQCRDAIETAASLSAEMTDQRAHARDDEANCHVRSADFSVWNDPDA